MNLVYNNYESINNNNSNNSNNINNNGFQSFKTASLNNKLNFKLNNNNRNINDIETGNSLKNNHINNNLVSYKRNNSSLNQVVCNLEPLNSPYKKSNNKNNNNVKRYSSNNIIKFDIGIIPSSHSPSSSSHSSSSSSHSSSSSSSNPSKNSSNKFSANNIIISSPSTTPTKINNSNSSNKNNNNNIHNDHSPSNKYLYSDFRKSSGTFSIENLTIDDSDDDIDSNNDSNKNSNINKTIEINNNSDNDYGYGYEDNDLNDFGDNEIDFNILPPIRKSGNIKTKEMINLELVQKVNENNRPKLQLTSHQSEYIINKIEREREIKVNSEIERIKEEMEEKFKRIRYQCEKERIEEINQFKFEQNQLYSQLELEHKQEKKKFIQVLNLKKARFKKEITQSRDIIIRCNLGEQLVRQELENQRLELIRQQQERKRKEEEAKEKERQRLEKIKKEKEEEEERKRKEEEEARRIKKEKEEEEERKRLKEKEEKEKKDEELKQRELLLQQQKEQLEQQQQLQQQQQQEELNNNNNNNINDYKYCKDFNNIYYNGYIERKEFLNNLTSSLNSNKSQLSKESLDYERQLVKSINIAINQISASKEQTESKAKKLIDILTNEKKKSEDYFYKSCLLAIANKSMGQVESQITFHLASAFPLSEVLVKVSKQYPDLLKLLLGKLEEHCIYIVPLYPIKYENEPIINYRKRAGYLISQETDKVVETEEEFIKRMCGYLSLFSSLILKSEQPSTLMQFGFGSLSNNNNNNNSSPIFNLDLAIKWLHAVISLKPIRITPSLLFSFLTNLGNILSKKENQAFSTLLSKLKSGEFLNQLSSMTGIEGSISRLINLTNNNFVDPEGLNYS